MNILVFSWRDLKHPKAGGAEQVMHQHAQGWVAAGHKVVHFSSKMAGLPDHEMINGIEFVRGGYQYLGVVLAGFIYYIRNRKNIDLIVDEFHGVPFFTPLYVKKPKIAVVQEVARNVWFLNPLVWPLNWIIGIIGFLGEPFVFLFYRNIPFMTGSHSAEIDLWKMGIPRGHVTVVPHGVIIESRIKNHESRIKKNKNKTTIFLGVLSKDKGIEQAIRCFAILHSQHPSWNFWIIGRSETPQYGRSMKELVIKLGLYNKTKFWGYVSQEKKFELLSKAHVLVNPSVHEGWGLVNIEANAMGTPVIAYRVAGSTDSVKNGVSGVLCQESSPENLAEIVLEILGDDQKYQKLQKGAIKWSKNFSWDKSKKLSLKLVEQLGKSKNGKINV